MKLDIAILILVGLSNACKCASCSYASLHRIYVSYRPIDLPYLISNISPAASMLRGGKPTKLNYFKPVSISFQLL